MNTLILAEANNIIRDNGCEMKHLFRGDGSENRSSDLASKMVHLVEIFGNYVDMYAEYLEIVVPRDSYLNHPCDEHQSTGMLCTIPFDYLDVDGDVSAAAAVNRNSNNGSTLE